MNAWEVLTLEEVAQQCNVTASQIRYAIKSGKLRPDLDYRKTPNGYLICANSTRRIWSRNRGCVICPICSREFPQSSVYFSIKGSGKRKRLSKICRSCDKESRPVPVTAVSGKGVFFVSDDGIFTTVAYEITDIEYFRRHPKWAEISQHQYERIARNTDARQQGGE